MKRFFYLVLALSVSVVLVGPSAATGSPRTSCPNGFVAYEVPQDEDALRALERIDAGLDAGVYTVSELVDLGNAIDANGDGIFCLKAVSNLEGRSSAQWGYYYGARDNDTAAS